MIKKVNVLGDEYKIKYRKRLIKGPDGDQVGDVDYYKKEILVHLDDKYEHHRLHEIGHAILERSGLNQTISKETAEIICEVFATVFLENKNIFLASKK